MAYIGHSPTNAGTFYILDALTMGSGTTYGMAVGGVSVSPTADNLLITLDGVIQHPGDAYTVSGSNIVFASGPGSGVEFYGIIMGQSASTGQGSIGADELKVSGDGSSGQVLTSDGDGTFSWATDTENYLPLAGGTMSGAINLGSQNITNGGTITGTFVGNITGNVTGNTSGTAATVTGAAQSAITSVGTLTGLTVAHNNITLQGTGETQLLVNSASGNNAGIRFQENSANKWTIGNDQSDDKLFFYDFTNTATRMVLETNGRLGVGSDSPDSLIHAKVTTNTSETIRIQNDDSLTTIGVSSDGYSFHTYQHSLYWASWDGSTWSTKARLDNDGHWCFGGTTPNIGGWNNNYTVLTLKGKAANYGGTLELANLDSTGNYFGSISFVNLDGGSSVTAQARISALPDGADDASAIVFETEPTGGAVSEKLRIRGSTTNWCLDVTSPSPYGMQITTTASNSSSHDMFKVKRGDGTTCIETFGDGNTKIENEIQTKAGLRTYATNGGNPAGDFYNVAHKFATFRSTVTSTHVTDGYVNFSSSIYRDNVIGVIANHFGAAATNVNHMGYQDSYIPRADLYAGGGLRAYLGSEVVAGDYVYLTIIYHGNTG